MRVLALTIGSSPPLLLIALLIAGCGQKGDLYLSETNTSSAETIEQEDVQDDESETP